ncbi:hypothetical protein HID58_071480, partial [Brassica napus]
SLFVVTKGNAISCHQKCFECSTLVTLKIHGGIDVTLVAGRIFLPMLKTLVLDWAMACPNDVSDLDLAIAIGSDEEDNYQLSPKCFECST